MDANQDGVVGESVAENDILGKIGTWSELLSDRVGQYIGEVNGTRSSSIGDRLVAAV